MTEPNHESWERAFLREVIEPIFNIQQNTRELIEGLERRNHHVNLARLLDIERQIIQLFQTTCEKVTARLDWAPDENEG